MRPITSHRYLTRTVLLAVSAALLTATTACESNPVLRKQGMDALAAGKVKRADNRFTKAVRQDVTDWKSRYYLGRVRIEQGRYLDAQLLTEQALALHNDHPETAEILDHLAEALYRQENYAALHELLKREAYNRGTTHDYLRQGRYLLKAGDRDGARVALLKAAKFAPNDPEPQAMLADFYETIGDQQSAIQALRHAHALAPADEDIADRLRHYGIVPGPAAALITDDS